jgi:hypothetical protein
MKIILNQMKKKSYKPSKATWIQYMNNKMRSGPYEVPNPQLERSRSAGRLDALNNSALLLKVSKHSNEDAKL